MAKRTGFVNHNRFNKWTSLEFLYFYIEQYEKTGKQEFKESTSLYNVGMIQKTWDEIGDRRDFKFFIIWAITTLQKEATLEQVFDKNKNRKLIETFKNMDV